MVHIYWRTARTFGIERPFRESALWLSAEKLITKLTESDVCYLCNFYSKLEIIEKQNKDYYESSIAYSIVLSEVVTFVKKTLKTSQATPAFLLSDLKQMFLKAYQRTLVLS